MSAIAGLYHMNREPVPFEHSNGMMKSLEKYPADDVQTWQDHHIFLGCHAQWITPESVGEKLPFYDEEHKCAITADAIIDNREDLFESLQVEKGKQKTMSDSELILLAYYKWGDDSPKYLVGDFAYMIWDEREQKLFGARDFSGARTLYYIHDQYHLGFCTVIHPLLTLPYIKKELNEEWLAEFLAISSMIDTVDMSITPYQNVMQVPPSHSLVIKAGNITFNRYSKITVDKKLKLKSDEEYVEAFQEVFQKAVTSRLRTHRKVGSQLSGGLDSGSVASFAAKALYKENKKLHTYSYVPPSDFKDWTPKHRLADERQFIKSTVKQVGNITDRYVACEGENSFLGIDEWLEIMEMPYKFFENSFWLKGIYEKAKEDNVGVLLNGSRGNFTISWGPALDYYANLLKRIQWLRFYRELSLYSKKNGVKASRVISVVSRKAFSYLKRTSSEPYSFPMLIHPKFAAKTHVFDKIQAYGFEKVETAKSKNIYEIRKEHFEQIFYWNVTGTNATKSSLYYDVLSRDPTNDIRVIQFCLSVPEEQCVKNGLDRALIRRSTESYLPDNVRFNQQFRGIQGADWLHRMKSSWHNFIDELEQMASDNVVSNLFNTEVIKTSISKVRKDFRVDLAFDPDIRILMRALIVYRFIKNIA